MFWEPAYIRCRHYHGEMTPIGADGFCSQKCECFPDGIPENHFCQECSEFDILDKKVTPPIECANGKGFAFYKGYKDRRIERERLEKLGYTVPE